MDGAGAGPRPPGLDGSVRTPARVIACSRLASGQPLMVAPTPDEMSLLPLEVHKCVLPWLPPRARLGVGETPQLASAFQDTCPVRSPAGSGTPRAAVRLGVGAATRDGPCPVWTGACASSALFPGLGRRRTELSWLGLKRHWPLARADCVGGRGQMSKTRPWEGEQLSRPGPALSSPSPASFLFCFQF